MYYTPKSPHSLENRDAVRERIKAQTESYLGNGGVIEEVRKFTTADIIDRVRNGLKKKNSYTRPI